MPVYNKLVRDHIPQIIETSGRKASVRILNDQDYYHELKKKTNEELEEFYNSSNKDEAIEELADLLEIINAFAKLQGATLEEVELVRQKKAEKRGGFKKKIFLIEVEEQ
jgi:predicted house-cleaning noncanonical NTP pyrophosphatase (MazG superfamily)